MAYLGEMYGSGRGVEQNNDTARSYYEKAARKKNPHAQSGLGMLYLHGQGVKPNPTKAFELFTAAAQAGNAEGQFNLGNLYYNGLGTRRDYRKAIHFFQLSAQQGHVLVGFGRDVLLLLVASSMVLLKVRSLLPFRDRPCTIWR